MRLARVLSVLCLFVTSVSSAAAPAVSIVESGKGLDHQIVIEAPGRYRLVMEAFKNYGITQWYDLAGDPAAKTDLLHNPTDYIPVHAQGALFNQLSLFFVVLRSLRRYALIALPALASNPQVSFRLDLAESASN